MELVNEWLPNGKFRKVDAFFSTNSTYGEEIMAALVLPGNVHYKAEMEDHGKFVHTLGRIQHISLMIRLDICYATCHLSPQTVAPTLPGFQYIKLCVQYLAIHPHRPIFSSSYYYDVSNFIRLTRSGNKV